MFYLTLNCSITLLANEQRPTGLPRLLTECLEHSVHGPVGSTAGDSVLDSWFMLSWLKSCHVNCVWPFYGT